MFLLSAIFLSDDISINLKKLAFLHKVYLIHINDPLEKSFPDVGLLEMVDLETGRKRLVDTGDRQFFSASMGLDQIMKTPNGRTGKKRNLHYFNLEVGDGFALQVRKFFKREAAI